MGLGRGCAGLDVPVFGVMAPNEDKMGINCSTSTLPTQKYSHLGFPHNAPEGQSGTGTINPDSEHHQTADEG